MATIHPWFMLADCENTKIFLDTFLWKRIDGEHFAAEEWYRKAKFEIQEAEKKIFCLFHKFWILWNSEH